MMFGRFRRQSPPVAASEIPPGHVVVPGEVAALATYVASCGGIDPATLSALLLQLGLVARVPFDPEAHTGDNDDRLIPGDAFLAYSKSFQDALAVGRAYLKGWNGRLH